MTQKEFIQSFAGDNRPEYWRGERIICRGLEMPVINIDSSHAFTAIRPYRPLITWGVCENVEGNEIYYTIGQLNNSGFYLFTQVSDIRFTCPHRAKYALYDYIQQYLFS